MPGTAACLISKSAAVLACVVAAGVASAGAARFAAKAFTGFVADRPTEVAPMSVPRALLPEELMLVLVLSTSCGPACGRNDVTRSSGDFKAATDVRAGRLLSSPLRRAVGNAALPGCDIQCC